MSATPAFSVLLPIYNDADYVPVSVESILNQTFTDFELIATDDGSTDNTLEVLKGYAAKDSRVRIVSRENRGLVGSLNEGLDLATGKYIARMDADDVSDPTRLEKQFAFMEANPDVGGLGTAVRTIAIDGTRAEYAYPTTDAGLRVLMMLQPPFTHSVVVYRRSVLEAHGIRYDESFKHAEDFDFYEKLGRVSKLANLPEVLHTVEFRGDSVSEENMSESRANRLKIMHRIMESRGLSATDEEFRAALGYDLTPAALNLSKQFFERLIAGCEDAERADMGHLLGRRFQRNIVIYYGLPGFFKYWGSSIHVHQNPGAGETFKTFIAASLRTARQVAKKLLGRS